MLFYLLKRSENSENSKRYSVILGDHQPREADREGRISGWVVATVENKSDHDLPVYRAISSDMDQGGWVYTVDVRDDKGVARPETRFYIFAQGRDPDAAKRTSGWATKVKPGGTLADRVKVSKLYDLNQPGKYTIQFQRLDPQTKTFVKSNEITVTVTPKEP